MISDSGMTYFWRHDQVEILHRYVSVDDFKQSSMLKYLYCHCVTFTASGRKYVGWFDQTENYIVGWMPYDLNKFEPEFRLALLLMGIT